MTISVVAPLRFIMLWDMEVALGVNVPTAQFMPQAIHGKAYSCPKDNSFLTVRYDNISNVVYKGKL